MASSSVLTGSRRRIATFVGKVLAFYGLWYIVYDLWLLPDGRLDHWVSVSIVEVSQFILGGFGLDAVGTGRALTIPNTPGIRIIDGCNGLSTIGLFVGFVLAFPGRPLRRVAFLPFGMAVIYATNVGRVVGLLLLQRYWSSGFEFVHGLGAPAFFYLVVFGLWMLWANYGGASISSSEIESASPAVA